MADVPSNPKFLDSLDDDAWDAPSEPAWARRTAFGSAPGSGAEDAPWQGRAVPDEDEPWDALAFEEPATAREPGAPAWVRAAPLVVAAAEHAAVRAELVPPVDDRDDDEDDEEYEDDVVEVELSGEVAVRTVGRLDDVLLTAAEAEGDADAELDEDIDEDIDEDVDGWDDEGNDATDVAGPESSILAPSSRWNKLDAAFGEGKERWRNLVTAAVAIGAMIIAIGVLWAVGEGPGDEELTAPAVASRAAADDLEALLDEPERVPEDEAAAAVPDPAPAAEAPEVAVPQAPIEAAAPSAPAEPAPAELAEPTPEPPSAPIPLPAPVVAVAPVSAPAPVVAPAPPKSAGPPAAKTLAKRAGCPARTLPTIVLPGDTLEALAWRHAHRRSPELVAGIRKANPALRVERLKAGDKVCIPASRVIVGYDQKTYEIRRGDTISGLAGRFAHLTQANLRALTSAARKKDMLLAGAKVRLPMPKYASL